MGVIKCKGKIEKLKFGGDLECTGSTEKVDFIEVWLVCDLLINSTELVIVDVLNIDSIGMSTMV